MQLRPNQSNAANAPLQERFDGITQPFECSDGKQISDVLAFGRLWDGEPDAISTAIDYAKFRSRSHRAVIRVYDDAGNVIETHENAGDFKEW